MVDQALELLPDRYCERRVIAEEHAEFDIPLMGGRGKVGGRDEGSSAIYQNAFCVLAGG